MKKIVALFLIFSQFAYAGLPPTTVKGQNDAAPKTKFAFQSPYNQITDLGGIKALIETGNKNILSNSSFEHVTATTGWTTTKTAGTTLSSAVETSVVTDGKQSIKITATAAYGTFDQSVTPTIQTVGQNYEASCRVYASSATGVPQICALAGGTEVQCVSVPVTSSWQEVSVALPGPANGTSVGVRFKTTVSDSTSYYLDDCYVGPNRKIASGYLATDWQSYTPTTQGFGTVANMTASWRRVGGEVQVLFYFEAGTPSATEARFYLPNSYVITGVNSTSNMQTGVGFFNTNQVGGYGSVGAVNGNTYVTFTKTTTSRTNENGNGITTTGSGVTAKFSVPVTGWTSSQAAYKVDATPASWSGYHDSTCSWSRTNIAYGNPTADATCGFTERYNRNFGTVTSSLSGSDKLPGIVITPPRPGRYFLCAIAKGYTTATGSDVAAIQLTDGTNQIGEAIIQTPSYTQLPICGILNAATSSSITLSLQTKATASAAVLGTNSTSVIDWSITELDAPTPAPYLVGSVTSNTSGQERVERAKVTAACTSSPCTIASQSGSWLTSISRSGTGTYSANFATGIFSAAPSCVCSAANGSDYIPCLGNPSNSTSSWSFATKTTLGGTSYDSWFDIICMGPK